MKLASQKRRFLYLFLLWLLLSGCTLPQKLQPELKKGSLTPLPELDQYQELVGYRAREGRFYFTALVKNQLNYYLMDLKTGKVDLLFESIQQNLSFIPLDEARAVFIDQDYNLFLKEGKKAIKIDGPVSGSNDPNLVVALNGEGLLYTKGEGKGAALYRYMLNQAGAQPEKLIDPISEEAYETFRFTTQWSHQKNYFIYHNERVYDETGIPIADLEATVAKWAPQDDAIAFIAMPEQPEQHKIQIGDWHTYVGSQFKLLEMKDKTVTTLLTEPAGLVDPIESIQWNQAGTQVGLSYGKMIETAGYFEQLDYQQILVYDRETKEKTIVAEMPYNFYEFVGQDHVYGKQLGTKGALALVNFAANGRRSYEGSKLLNGYDMFVVTGHAKNRSYLVNDRSLIELDETGQEKVLTEFPWDVSGLYWDEATEIFVVMNGAGAVYLYVN